MGSFIQRCSLTLPWLTLKPLQQALLCHIIHWILIQSITSPSRLHSLPYLLFPGETSSNSLRVMVPFLGLVNCQGGRESRCSVCVSQPCHTSKLTLASLSRGFCTPPSSLRRVTCPPHDSFTDLPVTLIPSIICSCLGKVVTSIREERRQDRHHHTSSDRAEKQTREEGTCLESHNRHPGGLSHLLSQVVSTWQQAPSLCSFRLWGWPVCKEEEPFMGFRSPALGLQFSENGGKWMQNRPMVPGHSERSEHSGAWLEV